MTLSRNCGLAYPELLLPIRVEQLPIPSSRGVAEAVTKKDPRKLIGLSAGRAACERSRIEVSNTMWSVERFLKIRRVRVSPSSTADLTLRLSI